MDFSVFDDVNAYVYVSDAETYELVYCNAFARKREGLPETEGCSGTCYSLLQKQTGICPYCDMEQLKREGKIEGEYTNPRSGRRYAVRDTMLLREGKSLRLQIAMDVSLQDQVSRDILERLSVEETLVDCMRKLNMAENFETAAAAVMEEVLVHYQGSRAAVFEFDPDRKTVTGTYEKRPGEALEVNRFLTVLPEETVCFWESVFQGIKAPACLDTDGIGEKFALTREGLLAREIRQTLAVPFYREERLEGFFSVSNMKQKAGNTYFIKTLGYFIRDEILKRNLQRQLYFLSYHDKMTELYNRNRYMRYENEYAEKQLNSVGILYADVNGLKLTNDHLGHAAGDGLIVRTAKLLQKNMPGKYLFRLSGDEFLAVCENCTEQDFLTWVRSLQREFDCGDRELASTGYVWSAGKPGLEELLKKSDELMYRHKEAYYSSHPGRRMEDKKR